MFADSTFTDLDLKNPENAQREDGPECTFWTRLDGQMCVQYFRPRADVFYQPHTHSEYVLVICLAGVITVRQWGVTEVLGTGQAVISNLGVEHTSSYQAWEGRRCEAVSLTLDRRLLTMLVKDFQLSTGDERLPVFTGKLTSPLLHACAREIAGEFQGRKAGHKIVLETQAVRLLVEALRGWPRTQMEMAVVDTIPRLPPRDFVRAYEFMRRCRKDQFRLQHLCSFLGCSEERFTRLFLASTHCTPASFYNRLILEQGRELLRDPALSIKEISYLLGFKTSSHFIVAFRREFTLSPQKYRLGGGVAATDLEFPCALAS